MRDYPQEPLVDIKDEKVPPFVKFGIIISILCFLLDFLTNEHCRTWSSMINLRIDSRKKRSEEVAKSKESCCQQCEDCLELSKENVLRNMMLSHRPCFI